MKRKKKITAWITGVCLTASMLAVWGGCKEPLPKDEALVVLPDGAPALAFAELMYKDTDRDGVTYRVVDSSTISLAVTGKEESKADFCVLPLNLASKLLGGGEEYQMLGLVTQGNMYMLSQSSAQISNLGDLRGETVGVLQLANVPGLTFKAALNRQEVAWQELTGDTVPSSEKVNLQAAQGVDGKFSYYLAPEPMVSKVLANSKLNFQVVGDLQGLYHGEDSSKKGYPQAVLVGKRAFLAENKEWTSAFVGKVASAEKWLYEGSAEEIFSAVTAHFADSSHAPVFTAQTLGKDTLARCGISFVYAKDCRVRIDEFLGELMEISPQSASSVNENFYWID